MPPATEERLAPLVRRVTELAERFAAAGFGLHLVGGSVRDALLGVPHRGDLDLTTDARPADTKAVVGGWAEDVWTQGERFGTIGCRRGDDVYEITTHRTEIYDPATRKPEVSFADELVTDLSRRDFTINAMAADAHTGALEDPFGGWDDLEGRRLRTPLEPEVSFTDDPLRMLRAGRFIARFDLAPDRGVHEAAVRFGARLAIVSSERIHDELMKLLSVDRPARGLSFLAETGLLSRFAPELDPQAPVDALAGGSLDRLSLLLVGADRDAVLERLAVLRASSVELRTVLSLLDAVAEAEQLGRDRPRPSLRRWVASVGDLRDRALALLDVVAPESTGALRAAVEHLAHDEGLVAAAPPLDGEDVMRVLGLEPGPAVGHWLERLREHALDHGPLDAAEAETLLRTWSQEG